VSNENSRNHIEAVTAIEPVDVKVAVQAEDAANLQILGERDAARGRDAVSRRAHVRLRSDLEASRFAPFDAHAELEQSLA